MARLYADENLTLAVVEELRRLGHDVLTVQETGQRGATDPQVLAYAIGAGRAVLTFNRRHFVRLHSSTIPHCGIVVCTDDNALALANRIHQALASCLSLANQLLRIDLPP